MTKAMIKYSIGKIMIMLNMQIKKFIEDTFEVPARNAQFLLKIKIPAIHTIFQKPRRITRESKRLESVTQILGGCQDLSGTYRQKIYLLHFFDSYELIGTPVFEEITQI